MCVVEIVGFVGGVVWFGVCLFADYLVKFHSMRNIMEKGKIFNKESGPLNLRMSSGFLY